VDVHFVPPDLRRLDALKSEALCVPFFADERPCAARSARRLAAVRAALSAHHGLARLGRAGRDGARARPPEAHRREALALRHRPARAFDEQVFTVGVSHMLTTLTRARVRASVVVLPGRALGLIAPVRAMEIFLRVASGTEEHDEITLVEDAEAQRAMEPVVERERRRARAVVA